MKFAVIDIGSNTVKLNVFDYSGGVCVALWRETVRGGLARYKNNGIMEKPGKDALLTILSGYKLKLLSLGITDIFPYATESLRGITNAGEICAEVEKKLGLTINIINWESEARLGFEAFKMKYPGYSSGTLSDMGGGSTELTVFDAGSAFFSCSMRFGSLALRELFSESMLPTSTEAEKITAYVRDMLIKNGVKQGADTLYACGGTSNGLFKLYSLLYGINSEEIAPKELKKLYNELTYGDKNYTELLKTELPDRYDSVMCGILAHMEICSYLGVKKIIHTESTAREGYAAMLVNNGLINEKN